jgi:hypothetical protein
MLQIIHAASMQLTLRYELIQDALCAGVDISSYDHHGNTVLMAFVTHLCDGEDDKTFTKLLCHFTHNGANMHWRNRQRQDGASHRSSSGPQDCHKGPAGGWCQRARADGGGQRCIGRGGGTLSEGAEYNQQLYAEVMALAIQFGAVATPTLVQEWSTPCVGIAT